MKIKAKVISPQRLWQLRKEKQGLCVICGDKKIFKGNKCVADYKAALEYSRKYYLKNKEKMIKAFKEWNKKHPGYYKEYYQKRKGESK